jgi:hypothetical protein
VELAEYHEGAQRGGIRVPEGYRGKGWVRFEQGLVNFFLGESAPAKSEIGNPRNGKLISNRKKLDLCDLPAKISPLAGIINSKDSVSLNLKPRVPLDPEAIRPTRKCDFKWNPNDKTLRITKMDVGKRHVEWVGLKYKACGLIQLDNCAPFQAQGLLAGSIDFGCPEFPVLDTHSTDNHDALRQDSSSLSSSSNEEKSTPSASPRGGDLASREAESPITSVWVDLASSAQVSGEMVLLGNPSFSDTQFEMGGLSTWEIEPMEASGSDSLPIVLVNELDGDLTSPLQCVPLATMGPSGFWMVLRSLF